MNHRSTKNLRWIGLLVLLVFTLGFILRIICIDKPEGLWIDEINTYFFASKNFPLEIIKEMLKNDLHIPSYYLLLHLWMDLFGNSDIALRALSVVFGILTLPVSYFIGKELNGYRGGLITLLMFSINSGLIYYSKEVRFYSAVLLFATMIALFLIRLKNNPTKLNYAGLIISNTLMIYTYTIGFVFVAIELAIFLGYLIYSKQETKKFFNSALITLFFIIPVIPFLIYFAIKNYSMPFYYFDYYGINWILLLNIISSFAGPLSPNNGVHYEDWTNCLLLLTPTAIFIFFIIKGVMKDKFVFTLFLVGFVPFLGSYILSLMGKFALTNYHAIFCAPFFIIAASYGMQKFKHKWIAFILFQIYLIINLTYTLYSPFSVNLIEKVDGFNTVATSLKNHGASEKDLLFSVIAGGELIEKYDYGARISPLNLKDNEFFNKDVFKYIFDENFVKTINKSNSYYKLKDFAYSKNPTPRFEKYIKQQTATVPQNHYVFVANNDILSSPKFSPTRMIPPLKMKISNDIMKIMNSDKNFLFANKIRTHFWTISVFKRIR